MIRGAQSRLGAMVVAAVGVAIPSLPVASVATAEPLGVIRKELRLYGGGLENYPNLGLGGGVSLRRGSWDFGTTLSAYLPATDGDVRRYAALTELEAQYCIVCSQSLELHLGLGVGLAIFHDAYAETSLFSDTTEVAPGLSLGANAQFPIRHGYWALLGIELVGYKTSEIADDEWLQVVAGVAF